MNIRFFNPTASDSDFALYFLLGMIVFVLILLYASYRYRRFKRFKEFVDEMKQLDLDQNEESTLSGMVKRYALDEPVQILVSLRLFDEMATHEIARILGSPASAATKKQFIDLVYEIRKKTYHPDIMTVAVQENGSA